jgi:hypothetical protein
MDWGRGEDEKVIRRRISKGSGKREVREKRRRRIR